MIQVAEVYYKLNNFLLILEERSLMNPFLQSLICEKIISYI
jgi:hypothetical protein